MKRTLKIALFVLFIMYVFAYFIAIGLYFYHFHNGFSADQNDWSAFGGYIGGLAAMFNVVVFACFTYLIHTYDVNARKRELHYRQKIFLTQQRQEKLKLLIDALDDATKVELQTPQFYKFNNTRLYLISFKKYNKVLFPIFDNAAYTAKINVLCDTLNNMYVMAMESAGFDKGGRVSAPKPISADFTGYANTYLQAKEEFITDIEHYVLDQIEQC